MQRLIDAIDADVDQFDRLLRKEFADDAGYRLIQRLQGVGTHLRRGFVAELGDVRRLAGAPQVCSWAGLTPRHRESDNTVHRGSITKQGSRLVRLGDGEIRCLAARAAWLVWVPSRETARGLTATTRSKD
jgi:transposase